MRLNQYGEYYNYGDLSASSSTDRYLEEREYKEEIRGEKFTLNSDIFGKIIEAAKESGNPIITARQKRVNPKAAVMFDPENLVL